MEMPTILKNTKFDWYLQSLTQWFPNFFGSRTTYKILVVREGQNIDLYRDSRTTSANLADHQWSAEQTLGITALTQGSQTQSDSRAELN